MTDKGLNLFDDYAAECVHLSPHEEEFTCSSWEHPVKCTIQAP